ncbi:MAG: ribonuclease III [Granulosicoccus sp.]
MAQLQALTKTLGYQFSDISLLVEALTHRSSGSKNYERLEFLGDSFLNFTIAAALYEQRPSEDEGSLSRLRASLVRQSTLAEIARELSLGDHLQMGAGELRSGGFKRDSVLSDVVESIIGAIFLDSGYGAAREFVLQIFRNRLKDLPSAADLKDPKTRLQELLQGRGLSRPEYDIVSTSGNDHEKRFTVTATHVELQKSITATASSRRKAEQAAAVRMLDELEKPS